MTAAASICRAVRKILSLSSGSGDARIVLGKIVSAAESVLDKGSLSIAYSGTNGYPTRVPDDAKFPTKYLHVEKAGMVGGRLWAAPLNGCDGALLYRGKPSKEEAEFLKTVADCVSVFLKSEAEKKPGRFEKHVEAISAFYEISQAHNFANIDELMRMITKKAALVMEAQACSLMLKDPHEKELVIKASFGLSDDVVEGARVAFGEGVAGIVAATGRPMILNNISSDPRFNSRRVVPKADIASSICVPLKDKDGKVQGVLNIRRVYPAEMFTEEDVKTFSVFASQASLAVSNAQLYSGLNRRLQELTILYEMSRELTRVNDLKSASERLLKVASQISGNAPAALLYSDSRMGMKFYEASGFGAWTRREMEKAMDEKTARWMHNIRYPVEFPTSGSRALPVAVHPFMKVLSDSCESAGFVPLITDGVLVGMMVLAARGEEGLDERRMRLLSIAASQAAGTIRNVMSHEEQLDRKVFEISTLFRLSQRVGEASNLNEALESILDIVKDIIWYDESFVYMVDSERKALVVQACRGEGCERLKGIQIPLGSKGLNLRAMKEKKAFLSGDVSKEPKTRQPQLCSGPVRSMMEIPLIVQDEVVGILNIHGYAPDLYTEDNVRLLSVIATQTTAVYRGLKALETLESYTDNILRSVGAGVATIDRDGKVLSWNSAAEEITSIYAADVLGLKYTQVIEKLDVDRENKKRLLDIFTKVRETGEKYTGYKQEYNSTGGDPGHINITVSQLMDSDNEIIGLAVVFEDVTKQTVMEKEMQNISELASVGRLAAVIAHEVRNPLSSIKGAAQYLKAEYEDHAAIKEFLDIIIEEVNVLNKNTTEFLEFARPVSLAPQEVDLNEVLRRTIKFMESEIADKNAEVRTELCRSLPVISADTRQLEQVVRNVILNSLQAIGRGGRIKLRTSAVKGGVKLAITDNGIGIPGDKIGKIFMPFYTTKTKGSGLGLAIAQKAVDNHGGRIRVESSAGRGTKFEIFLPVKADIMSIPAEKFMETDFLRSA